MRQFILTFALLAALLTAPLPARQPAAPPQSAIDAALAKAHAAFDTQNWAEAATHYQSAFDAGAHHPFVHFRLGYALHVTGNPAKALPHHLKAVHITNRALRIDAIYNAACASALLDRPDDALRYLTMAIDVGFIDTQQVGIDTDLDALRTDPRFQALVEGIGTSPRLDQQLDPFLGSWQRAADEAPPEVQARQRFTITRPLPESDALHFTEISPDGTQWSGMLFPRLADRTWVWSTLDGSGTAMHFVGSRSADGSVQFTGQQHSPAGPGVHIRLTLRIDKADRFTITAETSPDGDTFTHHHEWAFTRTRGG